ncbi:hypothetical protein OIY81_3506 [Cryptosporidium canis]|nr:hypothetical protein OIY81_3506 [Cryptosporidium canis]
MQGNSFDEIPIRDTIKLLHNKLSLLFYLDSLKCPKVIEDIDSSISKCTDYSISSCAEIIIPPIIMAVHNCIENHLKTQPYQLNEKEHHDYNVQNTNYSLQLEELLKVLLNVLQKMKSKMSKIVFSRLSMAFYDILYAITKVLHIHINKRNEYIVELCIKITHLDFNIFWEHWEYKGVDIDENQQMIIPVIIQFLLRISFPNTNEIKYSKAIRHLSLKLLSEIPSIIKDRNSLMKVYPGVIQKLSILVINSISEKNLDTTLEISLSALMEWIDHCLSSITPGTSKYDSDLESIINTGKVLNYIIKYKTAFLNISLYSGEDCIHSFSNEVNLTNIKRMFVRIAINCTTKLFDTFHGCYIEVITTCIDFLVSMMPDCDSIDELVDSTFNSIYMEQNDKKRQFFFDYLSDFQDHFKRINVDTFIFELDKENNLEEFIRTLSMYIGFQNMPSQLFKDELNTLCSKVIINDLFMMLTSQRNLMLYNKSIKDFDKVPNESKYRDSSINIGSFNLKAIDVAECFMNSLTNEHFGHSIGVNNCDFDTIEKLEVFQLYGHIFTSVFFNNRLGFDESMLVSKLILSSISVSMFNLSVEKTEYKTILDYTMQYISSTYTKKNDEFEPMIDFLARISLCNATQIILKGLKLGSSRINLLPGTHMGKLPNLVTNWFELTIEQLEKDFLLEEFSNKREINRNIILIFMSNLLIIAKEIDLDTGILIKKLNTIIIQLISLYSHGSSITKKIVANILSHVMQNMGFIQDKFSISMVIGEFSVEIIRSLEMMCYKGYSKAKVLPILNALEYCKLEFILELTDIVERFNYMNLNRNHWIFYLVSIITKRLSTHVLSCWRSATVGIIFKSPETSILKQSVESMKSKNAFIREACNSYFTDYIISQLTNELDSLPERIFFNSNTENQPLINVGRASGQLLKETEIVEISKIRKLSEKVIQIIYPYTSNIEQDQFLIFDYQYLSTYSLINCIFILSTDKPSLYPFVNVIIPTLINQWIVAINNIRKNDMDYFRVELIKSRELYLANQILIQLIISCGDFAIQTLEDKLVPLIIEYVKFVLSCPSIVQLMDDKEAEINSEFQKLCVSVIEVLYFFTKFYLQLNATEVKFETLNNIVNLLLSPNNSFFSSKWRIFIVKTMLHIYFKFPSIINSKLLTYERNNSIMHIDEMVNIIKFFESSIFTVFKSGNKIIPETQGELNLKLKINYGMRAPLQ